MSVRADIVVYGKDSSLRLLVEVKSKKESSVEWATKFRRNIYIHGNFPDAPFFLLALPDKFYLWKKDNLNLQEAVEPKYVIDASPILNRFYNETKISHILSGSSLEIILSTWLKELMRSDKSDYDSEYYKDWLIDSGLFDAIRDGYIETEVYV